MPTFQRSTLISSRSTHPRNDWNPMILSRLRCLRLSKESDSQESRRPVSWNMEKWGKVQQINKRWSLAKWCDCYLVRLLLNDLRFQGKPTWFNKFVGNVLNPSKLLIDILIRFSDGLRDQRFQDLLLADYLIHKFFDKVDSIIERNLFPLSEWHCSHTEFGKKFILL